MYFSMNSRLRTSRQTTTVVDPSLETTYCTSYPPSSFIIARIVPSLHLTSFADYRRATTTTTCGMTLS
jgi:hypothetical protein